VRHRLDEALAGLAAAVGAVEHREVLGAQVRGALDGHATHDDVVDLEQLRGREAPVAQQVEARRVVVLGGDTQPLEGLGAEHPGGQRLRDVEHAGKRLLGLLDLALVRPLLSSTLRPTCGALVKVLVPVTNDTMSVTCASV
jgi:hypothetical protein